MHHLCDAALQLKLKHSWRLKEKSDKESMHCRSAIYTTVFLSMEILATSAWMASYGISDPAHETSVRRRFDSSERENRKKTDSCLRLAFISTSAPS